MPADAPDLSDVPLRGARARAFARMLPRAATLLTDRVRVLRVTRLAYERLADGGDSPLKTATRDAKALIRLLSAYAHDEYRRIPLRSLLYALGAVLYFLSPVDLVPDFIPGVGYLDDVAVVVAVVKAISKDLDAFRRWETTTAGSVEGRATPRRGSRRRD